MVDIGSAHYGIDGHRKKAHIPARPHLQEMAQAEGGRFVACKMTVDMLEFTLDDFIEGVTIKTAEDFIGQAQACKVLRDT